VTDGGAYRQLESATHYGPYRALTAARRPDTINVLTAIFGQVRRALRIARGRRVRRAGWPQ
jgi:hypothetical protein